jgi:hypothetical protein
MSSTSLHKKVLESIEVLAGTFGYCLKSTAASLSSVECWLKFQGNRRPVNIEEKKKKKYIMMVMYRSFFFFCGRINVSN